MNTRTKKLARNLAFVVVGIAVIFFVFDNIVMPSYVQKGKSTAVPNVVGMSFEEACTLLTAAGLVPREAERKQDRHYPVGTVILQNPLASVEVKFGRGVYLTISGGELQVPVPNLRGKSIREASFNLERYNLKLGTVQYEPSEEFFENTIIRQNPSADTKVAANTVVQIVVSQGRSGDKKVVPLVTLKSMTEAEKILTKAGFKIGTITYQVSLDLLPNTVIEQYPHGGELIAKDQNIDLIIAQKSEKKTNFEY